MTNGNDKNRDETNDRETTCDVRRNETEASGDAERFDADEARSNWSRDTERLVKAMRNAMPPDHPLTEDADRWLENCDYWIEDLLADRELPPLEPGEGRFERPSACDCDEEHPPGPLRGEAATRFYEES